MPGATGLRPSSPAAELTAGERRAAARCESRLNGELSECAHVRALRSPREGSDAEELPDAGLFALRNRDLVSQAIAMREL